MAKSVPAIDTLLRTASLSDHGVEFLEFVLLTDKAKPDDSRTYIAGYDSLDELIGDAVAVPPSSVLNILH
jgi:hypothetical protein